MSEQQPDPNNNNNNNEKQPTEQPTTEEVPGTEQLNDAQLDEEIRATRQKLRELILKRKQIRKQKCKGKKGQRQPPCGDEQGNEWGPDPEFNQWGPGFWPGPWGHRKGHHGHHGGHKHNKHWKQWGPQYPPFFCQWGPWDQPPPEFGPCEGRPQGPPGQCPCQRPRGPQGHPEPCDKNKRNQPPQGPPPQEQPPQGPPHGKGGPRGRGPQGPPPPEWAMYGGYGPWGFPGYGAPPPPQEENGEYSSSNNEEESYGENEPNGNEPGYYGPDW
ncbi:hypothetical protein M9Y10_002335 [Tritrichomonas musculus]|uniref:Uncharacterized protein n=1 Tax=Tritrichomonas musculus TaxID=1915356 RepID=A0ABR2L9W2_9EUKA